MVAKGTLVPGAMPSRRKGVTSAQKGLAIGLVSTPTAVANAAEQRLRRDKAGGNPESRSESNGRAQVRKVFQTKQNHTVFSLCTRG